MPEALVRGIHINYEIIGDHGPFVALTPGSRRSFSELIDLSKAIAACGYRVLLHDRRNCGASDVAFDGSGSEHDAWADDLYELGRQLGGLPMYVGGSSAGARLAILYAMRHPDGVRGLLLWRVTGGQEAIDKLSENYYGQYIKLAGQGGMQAVVDSEHFAECIKARPSNRDRLLATSVDGFIKVMTIWRDRFLQSATLPIVGATEADLNAIKAPACLIAGNDVIHTPATARKAARLIPDSELHEDVVKKWSDDNLLKDWDRKEWRDAEPRLAAIFSAFLARADRREQKAAPLRIRRVVTGHTADGRAKVEIDEIAGNVISNRPGASSCVVWSTKGFPVDNDGFDDVTRGVLRTTVDNGTVFRIVRYDPGVSPRNHRTDSIDYAVVISGAIEMEIDDGVVVNLSAGDVLVQRGTVHNWVNRGPKACTIAFALIAAKPVTAGGKTLQAEG
jgi:pimeloyl-ACP methyl ester carboxylesterase/mannose-6-phosphate isomerase-like protein (cupin superfamily)